MHIMYAVEDISHISGGTRVIIEHVNGLKDRGHTVEVWVRNETAQPYFKCNVPIKKYSAEHISKPEVVVLTSEGFIPDAVKHRSDKKTFLLLQHDNQWVQDTSGIPSQMYLVNEHKVLFTSGIWSIMVVSKWLQEVVRERYNLDSIHIPNGIDPKLFHPAEPYVVTNRPTLLLYYDPQPWKGFMDGATAALEVRKTYLDLEVLIIGTFFPEYKAPDGSGLRFSFPATYFNVPTQDTLARIYSSATVFVSASWREGFGLPGLEAMACGIPLVTTDAGGVSDYATNGENAVVVPSQNTRALIDGILRVLDDQPYRDKLVRQARKVTARFEWEKTIARLEKSLH